MNLLSLSTLIGMAIGYWILPMLFGRLGIG